jgi:hypothetical protein
MMTDKQLEVNRRNALRSTGPKTEEGVQGCKNNVLRHGLRALQTVIPGEDPDEWEMHRAAVVADLAPEGAVETALAEQVAAKLWRLGRVVCYEADLIANAQEEDEVLHAHEKAHVRLGYSGVAKRTDIPTRDDVTGAKQKLDQAKEKLADRTEALGQLKALTTMKDEDALPDWTLYEVLRDDFHPDADALERLFKADEDEGPFLARHARKLIAIAVGKEGDLDDKLRESLAVAWAEQRKQLKRDVRRLRSA